MGLLLGNTKAGQKIDDGLGFNFQLAGQLVNTNLIDVGHAFRLGHLLLRTCLWFVVLRILWRVFGLTLRIRIGLGSRFRRQLGFDFGWG